ncbi:hypothetical protein GCM10017083_16030 [Thalassobaculum fulvum]|uniref:Uncharacterized protein n=1 Tax=Thalassobaculum fulvum TaxID=1633335 RepID=A0A918XRB9_9PROT|nr:hypothetical protein [Thalassobaculum fulvum]GHD46651.1 hypothetical protein GCM10017083_16030 [Thalassobaculum fulvum]
MSAAAVLATVTTLAALSHLAATDPKRRRAAALPVARKRRRAGLAVTAALCPGFLLLTAADGVDFTLWLSAASLGGWGVAACPPRRAARAMVRLARATAAPRHRLAGILMGRSRDEAAGRIAELERRVDELQADLAASARRRTPAAAHCTHEVDAA